jgi:hypothetical protein
MGDNEGVDFSWSDTNSVVVEPVEAIAVYRNPKGAIVIRQQDTMGGDDMVVIIPQSRLQDVILALQNQVDD